MALRVPIESEFHYSCDGNTGRNTVESELVKMRGFIQKCLLGAMPTVQQPCAKCWGYEKSWAGTWSPRNVYSGRRKRDVDGKHRELCQHLCGRVTGQEGAKVGVGGWKRLLIEEAPTCLSRVSGFILDDRKRQ